MKSYHSDLDLMNGIDPIEFIINSKTEFLHIFKKYARTSSRDFTQRERLAFSRGFAFDMNNYRLQLMCCQFKLHGEAEGLLSVLLAFMDEAWDYRNVPDRKIVSVADDIVNAYISLADWLALRTSKT